MNFYPHHIGDFNNSTRHLTRVERALYRDAIELYYDTESVLTNDFDWLARKLIATSEDEKTALKMILNEFFEKTDLGWLHHRCERELDKYRANASNKAKAGKASAEARRIAKHNLTPVEQPLISVEQTKNQEPLTNNQKHLKTLSDTSDAKEIIDYLNLKAGRKFKPVKANITMISARLKEYTKAELMAVVDEKCRGWAADEKMVGYLRPETLFNATKCAGYVGSLGAKVDPNGGAPWYLLASGIEEKAIELKIVAIKDEVFRDFKIRVFQAAGITPEMFRKAKADWGNK